MAVNYKGIAIVSFDVYRISDNSYRDTINFTQPIKSFAYKTKKKLKDGIGDNDEWGDENAQFLAVASAADHVGVSLDELTEDPREIDTVTGASLEARNIKGDGRNVTIEGKEEIPEDVLDRIERLEGLIKESKKYMKRYEKQIAELLVKGTKGEKMSDEDRDELKRLDGYISTEKENIRKFEAGIRRLKEEWGIE